MHAFQSDRGKARTGFKQQHYVLFLCHQVDASVFKVLLLLSKVWNMDIVMGILLSLHNLGVCTLLCNICKDAPALDGFVLHLDIVIPFPSFLKANPYPPSSLFLFKIVQLFATCHNHYLCTKNHSTHSLFFFHFICICSECCHLLLMRPNAIAYGIEVANHKVSTTTHFLSHSLSV